MQKPLIAVLLASLIVAGCGGGDSSSGGSNVQGGTQSAHASTASAWSGPFSLPIVPVAAANLPDGKVLTWSAFAPNAYGDENAYGYTYSAIFDPATQTGAQRVISETGHDMFCPGTAQLADGRILVNGGSSSQKTSIYDPAAGTWSIGPLMNIPRGYEGDATLADGAVLTLGGSWSGGVGNKNAEVWTANGGWRLMSGIPVAPFIGPDPAGTYRGDNHLWLFTYTGNRVFHAGPSAEMHWISTSGTGGVTSAGSRGDDAYSMNGNAVMYDVGKILKTGGAPAYEEADATTNAYVIDIEAGSVRKVAPMNYARTLHNSVVLPNGQVVITGGQTYSSLFSDERAILMAELWDPKTETFTKLSTMQVPRVYHSFSILLMDGRVLVGGGGLCGSCTANHPDVEILTPPYLLNPDGSTAARPTVALDSSTASYGGTISATSDSSIAAFALMRMSAVTHSVNNDQRRVPLQSISSDGRNYRISMPSDPGVAPPGNYMLFALSKDGVPSVAKLVHLS